MIKIEDKMLEDKLKNVAKGIEVLGGKSENDIKVTPDELMVLIVDASLKGQEVAFRLFDKKYTINDIVKAKIEFEKHLIKNKGRVIKYMVSSITKCNSEVMSLFKKYRKDPKDSIYKELEQRIIKTYNEDINKLILVNCDINDFSNLDESKYYGEYLLAKREELIFSVVSKL